MAMYDYWDFFTKLVETSELRAKVDPRTQWYVPRDTKLKEFFSKKYGDTYLYVDAVNVPYNKCKDLIVGSSAEKIVIHTYFDKPSSTLLANTARMKGCKVVIEFIEHASEKAA